MIEKALAQNKQYVFQFFTNVSTVNRLRQEAINLTWELTLEIQRELKQQNKQRFQEKARESRNSFSSSIIYTLVASQNIGNRMSKTRNRL
jgi:post-segregation antitoxin (ccd killing protein)